MDMTRQQAIDLDNDVKFCILKKEMEKIVEVEMDKLVRCEDPAGMVRLQERIRALQFCSKLPSIIAEREEDEPESTIILPRS